MPDEQTDEFRWHVAASRGEKSYAQALSTLQAAIEDARVQINEEAWDKVEIWHDRPEDVRLRWTIEKQYEHMTPYVRDYLRGLISM